jgi:hypothetical protein
MTAEERLVADYAGTHLTIGPHPMAMRRGELAMRGVLRASDLPRARDGRRIRVAGSVITRQRPGTAKGFVFLTLEDETGIANIIIRPDLFDRERFQNSGRAVSADRRRPAEPGRRHLHQGRPRARPGRRQAGLRFPRFSLIFNAETQDARNGAARQEPRRYEGTRRAGRKSYFSCPSSFFVPFVVRVR